jgi:uncharacterized membrane protein YcaP (DUF421 family)
MNPNILPYLQIVVNCVCVYLFMMIALRIFGKRELSQLNPIDIILILLISNAVQNAMVNTGDGYKSLGEGLVAAFVLFVLNFIFKKIVSGSKVFSQLIDDKPQILIHDGKTDFKTLARLGINSDELDEAMREHGVENHKGVKLAMMEIDGNISIISGDKTLKQTHHKRKIHKTLGTLNN